jgi:hypothetical protein
MVALSGRTWFWVAIAAFLEKKSNAVERGRHYPAKPHGFWLDFGLSAPS